MQAHKLQVKVFAAASAGVTTEAFVPILHDWIKRHVLNELMIDVANYAHVPKGPGVVLIGHDTDYFIDQSDGRFGLLYNRKRSPPPPAERLVHAFRHALRAADLLQQEAALAGALRFSATEFQLRINDRLTAPNTEATFEALKSELEALATKLFEGPYTLQRGQDRKALFSVTLTATQPNTQDLTTLLSRLGNDQP